MWKYKGGKGIWKQYENTETGEKSIKEHELKKVKQWCSAKDHNFVIKDIKKRLAECSICGQEMRFIVGKHKIENNKVILQ